MKTDNKELRELEEKIELVLENTKDTPSPEIARVCKHPLELKKVLAQKREEALDEAIEKLNSIDIRDLKTEAKRQKFKLNPLVEGVVYAKDELKKLKQDMEKLKETEGRLK